MGGRRIPAELPRSRSGIWTSRGIGPELGLAPTVPLARKVAAVASEPLIMTRRLKRRATISSNGRCGFGLLMASSERSCMLNPRVPLAHPHGDQGPPSNPPKRMKSRRVDRSLTHPRAVSINDPHLKRAWPTYTWCPLVIATENAPFRAASPALRATQLGNACWCGGLLCGALQDVDLAAGPWCVGESLVGCGEGAAQRFGEPAT